MLAAQAIEDGARLVGLDTAFDDIPGLSRLW
jgi:predicted nucleic acid-binding protein